MKCSDLFILSCDEYTLVLELKLLHFFCSSFVSWTQERAKRKKREDKKEKERKRGKEREGSEERNKKGLIFLEIE